MPAATTIDHYGQLFDALAADRREEIDRLLMFEVIAVEVIRAGSVAAARVSLLGVIENVDGRWREIGPSWRDDGQLQRVLDDSWRARTLPVPHGRPPRAGDWVREGRVRVLAEKPLARADGGGSAVPWATLVGWIEDELRPRGLLAPSTGRGRPRRGTSKYAPGPALATFM